MRGTGPVTVERDTLYAYFTTAGRAAPGGLAAADCDRRDQLPGRPVRVGLAGRNPAAALVTAAAAAPPFVWVEMEFTAAVGTAG
jgi:hypothetical protein